MNCCGEHSHKDHAENNEHNNIENKNQWLMWIIAGLIIILLIFSFMK